MAFGGTSNPDVQKFTRILESVNLVQQFEDLTHIGGRTIDLFSHHPASLV